MSTFHQSFPMNSLHHCLTSHSGIQQNLHIVLIMDSSNPNFTINCESNPAFYRKCSVQWMEGWSESSMKKVNIRTARSKWALNHQQLIKLTLSVAYEISNAHSFQPLKTDLCNSALLMSVDLIQQP